MGIGGISFFQIIFAIITVIIIWRIFSGKKKSAKSGSVAGAIASLAVGYFAGKALNKKLTGDVDSLDSDLIRKIEKERADEQRQYEEDERRRHKEQHKWREDTEFDPDRKW